MKIALGMCLAASLMGLQLCAESKSSDDLTKAAADLGPLKGQVAADLLERGFMSALQNSKVEEKDEKDNHWKYWVYEGEVIKLAIETKIAFDPIAGVADADVRAIRVSGGDTGVQDSQLTENDPSIIADKDGISAILDSLRNKSVKVTTNWIDREIVNGHDSHPSAIGVDDGSRSFSGHPGLFIFLKDDKRIFLEGDIAGGRFNSFINTDLIKVIEKARGQR